MEIIGIGGAALALHELWTSAMRVCRRLLTVSRRFSVSSVCSVVDQAEICGVHHGEHGEHRESRQPGL